jgi:hypothetical protein
MKLLELSGHYFIGVYAETQLDFEAIRLIMRKFVEVSPPSHGMPGLSDG